MRTLELSKVGICQDTNCVDAEYDDNDMPIPTDLSYVAYIASNERDAWICDGCLDEWRYIQEVYKANRGDAADAGAFWDMGGEPFIENYTDESNWCY